MGYDYKKIGKRIKKERIAAGFRNQSQFAEKMNLSPDSRTTIGEWENGKVFPEFDRMLKMCNLFDCELGYLLCEYDCKKREVTDVKEVTGLSEKAIDVLSHMKVTSISESVSSLNKILEHEKFYDLLRAIHIHAIDFNHDRFRVDQENVKHIANALNCNQDEVKKYLESSSKSAIESIFMNIIEDIDLGMAKKRTVKRSSKA